MTTRWPTSTLLLSNLYCIMLPGRSKSTTAQLILASRISNKMPKLRRISKLILHSECRPQHPWTTLKTWQAEGNENRHGQKTTDNETVSPLHSHRFNLSTYLNSCLLRQAQQATQEVKNILSALISRPGNGRIHFPLLLKARNAEDNSFLYLFCL